LKQHKPWFDEKYSKKSNQIKQAKLQWLQKPSQINGQNLNSARCKTSRTFRNVKGKYMKDEIIKFEMNSKNKTIRDS